MHQLLIVDDEWIAVEGLKTGLDWSGLGIDRVFTAYNASQAKEIIQRERVDILLCDIEMPQGSGLELLQWIRGYDPGIEAVFLTCHADFHYAKQAIQLGSFDYLLKPVPFPELEQVIGRMIRKMEQDSERNEFSRYGKYWVQHQPLLVERFWLDILQQEIPSSDNAIKQAAEERNIPYSERMIFLPVLIHVRRWYKEVTLRDEKIVEYAIRKSAEEIIQERTGQGLLLSLGRGRFLAMISGDLDTIDQEKFRSMYERYIQICRDYFYAGVSCYIGEPVHGSEIASMFLRLSKMDENNVAYDSHVFWLKDKQTYAAQHLLPDMDLWGIMLKEGARGQMLAAAEEYMESQVANNQLTPDLLNRFIQDFQQMMYYVLQVKGVQAHQLLGDRKSLELYARSTRSATDSLAWIRHVVDKAMNLASSVEHSPSVVEKVKSFIRQHLAEDLSREDIASHVFLNPDYLTRIFKRETGMSISDYVLQQRLDIAAKLLTGTDLPVSAIATQIGYANFSHFSRMFKKYMNQSPVEYRQSH
ncbi:response regulator [Paenibacillus donghaensis]|nr:response regulator [Paenibacillus donghaensis]